MWVLAFLGLLFWRALRGSGARGSCEPLNVVYSVRRGVVCDTHMARASGSLWVFHLE